MSARELGEPLIELRGVAKDYVSAAGTVHAMRDVDLTIRRGEFVAIVGTSGSGKSTMMNILGCLDRPTRGSYLLEGLDVGERTNDGRAIVRNRLIGFIFQGFNLLSRTTALENVELPLQYRGFGARVRRQRALKSLEQVSLADRTHHTPNQLSGGQQQRVAIARALVTDPPLLLADEPTGNLDTRTSLEVLALLQKLNQESGITICLVTHEQDIALCAQRVITMRDGRIVSDVVQDQPTDAAAALAALPPPQEYGGGPELVSALSPADALRIKLGGPVPVSVYFMMLLGWLLGMGAGALYNGVVLGHPYPWIVALLGALGESFVASWFARRKLGQPLTSDQRARLGIWYTIYWGTPWALALVASSFASPGSFAHVAEQMGGLSLGGLLGLWVAILAALALLRYLLLTLFSSVSRPRLDKSAKNANGAA
jgi:putative ABC transport system ATP-binding protein